MTRAPMRPMLATLLLCTLSLLPARATVPAPPGPSPVQIAGTQSIRTSVRQRFALRPNPIAGAKEGWGWFSPPPMECAFVQERSFSFRDEHRAATGDATKAVVRTYGHSFCSHRSQEVDWYGMELFGPLGCEAELEGTSGTSALSVRFQWGDGGVTCEALSGELEVHLGSAGLEALASTFDLTGLMGARRPEPGDEWEVDGALFEKLVGFGSPLVYREASGEILRNPLIPLPGVRFKGPLRLRCTGSSSDPDHPTYRCEMRGLLETRSEEERTIDVRWFSGEPVPMTYLTSLADVITTEGTFTWSESSGSATEANVWAEIQRTIEVRSPSGRDPFFEHWEGEIRLQVESEPCGEEDRDC